MKNRKTTKKALLMSALSLLLCFSMLIGTTFAWFTDEVKSGTNQIIAGNLDVDVYYGNPAAKNSIEGVSTLFNAVTLWEPGAVAYENLTVVNLGNLALKYQLAINFTNENTVNGYGLSQVLKVAVVPGGFTGTREAAMALKGTALADFTLPGTLETQNETDVYGIVIYWAPSADDNNWNVNNGKTTSDGKPLHIDLGIKLVATQLTKENDSFGPEYDGATEWLGGYDYSWYDPDATEMTIMNAEQLAAFAAIVNGTAMPATTYAAGEATTVADTFVGKTIKLTSDIDLADMPWAPIGDPMSDGYVGFEGTFDGNGHTIYNLNVNNPTAWGQGLFGYISKNVTIKNLNVHNASVKATDCAGIIVGYTTYGIFSNIHVTGNITVSGSAADGHVGGIAGCGYYASFDNCSVIANGEIVSGGSFVGGIVGYQCANTKAITNCTVKNIAITGDSSVGGIAGIIASGTTFSGNTVEKVTLTKARVGGFPKVGALIGAYDGSKDTALANCSAKDVVLNGVNEKYDTYNALYGAGYDAKAAAKFDLTSATSTNVTTNFVEVVAIETVDNLTTALSTSGKYFLKNDLSLTTTITVPNGVDVTLYMNGKTIAGTFSGTGNQDMFLVKGNLTVYGGEFTMTATVNQGWSSMADIFDITAGGVVTLDGVTASVAGTDMNFIAHLNNWGTASLYVNNCDFTTTYVAIRAFNSGYDMNTVTVKNTAFHGGRVFWVHNYTAEGKDDSTLTLDIYGNGNTTDNAKPVRYGFSDSLYYTMTGALIQSAANQAELNSALTGNTSVDLADGNYTLPGATNSNITINGSKDTVISVTTPAFHGSDVTFNGVTIKANGGYVGIQHVKTVTYNDVTVDGSMKLYGDKVVFNNCTFNLVGDYIWTYGAKEVEFNNCTFNTTGKAILVYNEGAGASKVTVKGCTFNATAGAKAGAIANQNCAAIEIDNFQSSGTGVAHELITEGNTYSENFSGEWRIKNYVSGNEITVNGEEYTTIAIDGKVMTIDSNKNVTVEE